jgi:tRNA A-37 threonylcarbamoyl transferase component Bud32
VVIGYNGYWPWIRSFSSEPTNASVFFVHFYLVSVASALCMLFFRAWFAFPLNFVSNEHDIEFTESGIKRKSLKSWFFTVLTMNRWATGGGPDSLKWSEVKELRRMEEGFTKLCPLPDTAFKKESLTYKLLNKGAAFMDGLTTRMNSGNYLIFSTKEGSSDFGRNIRINLNDLSRAQRAKLFYAVKKWAPHVVVQKTAEEQLLGSTVLRDNRYTQLWFDMLTSRTERRTDHLLTPGAGLKNGEYSIAERISSGGQATAYLAKRGSGNTCVLKEFILAASTSFGAVLESAREFESEVSMLSQLNHPGIVRLEDFFCEIGRVYVVLEHISGQSLRQKVKQEGALAEAEVVRIAASVCEVLEYLHSQTPPIVHRDITPENILIQPDGTIKVIDFSLAVKQDGRRTTDSCAKQCFTPPEQFREEVSPQSDIYALGATMYFLLTGLTPKPISVSSPKMKSPEISDEVNAIVERATQLDLSQRYENAHWLKLELLGKATKAE